MNKHDPSKTYYDRLYSNMRSPATASRQPLDPLLREAEPAFVIEPQAIDLSNPAAVKALTAEEYGVLRQQIGMTGSEYGRGALDSASREDWVAAAARKSGRSATTQGTQVTIKNPDGIYIHAPTGRQDSLRLGGN